MILLGLRGKRNLLQIGLEDRKISVIDSILYITFISICICITICICNIYMVFSLKRDICGGNRVKTTLMISDY